MDGKAFFKKKKLLKDFEVFLEYYKDNFELLDFQSIRLNLVNFIKNVYFSFE